MCNTCIHECTHTYYIHTYIHAYIHAYTHAYIHTYIHTYVCIYMHIMYACTYYIRTYTRMYDAYKRVYVHKVWAGRRVSPQRQAWHVAYLPESPDQRLQKRVANRPRRWIQFLQRHGQCPRVWRLQKLPRQQQDRLGVCVCPWCVCVCLCLCVCLRVYVYVRLYVSVR